MSADCTEGQCAVERRLNDLEEAIVALARAVHQEDRYELLGLFERVAARTKDPVPEST